MPQRILSSLTWKAGVAIAATAIAAGTGATTFNLVNDSHPAGDPAVEVSDHASTTTTTVDGSTTTCTTVDDHGDDDGTAATNATNETATTEHPDNIGKTVSEDAHDGGVDGQEISDMAHERNAARAGADHATADDHSDEADDQGQDEADDQGDDHRADANDHAGQDGSHQDDGTDD
jgi:hypothetical protein